MKIKTPDDINVNVSVDIPGQDIEDIIDKLVEGTVVIIMTYTAAHILKSWLGKS